MAFAVKWKGAVDIWTPMHGVGGFALGYYVGTSSLNPLYIPALIIFFEPVEYLIKQTFLPGEPGETLPNAIVDTVVGLVLSVIGYSLAVKAKSSGVFEVAGQAAVVVE